MSLQFLIYLMASYLEFFFFFFLKLLQKEMVNRRYDAYNGMSTSDFSVIATEYTPLFKWLGSRTHESLDQRIDMMNLDDQESVVSDDEIEDW